MTGGAFEGTLAGFSLNLKRRPGRFSQSERGRRAEGGGRRAWLPILLPYQYENSWAVSAHWGRIGACPNVSNSKANRRARRESLHLWHAFSEITFGRPHIGILDTAPEKQILKCKPTTVES